MKLILFAAIVSLLCAGCAAHREGSLSPVGPEPGLVTSPAQSPANGTLIVYSAWRRTGTDDADHRVHSNYEILTADGKPFLQVNNYISPMLDDPATVQLAPGNYSIKARVQGYGYVSVPVVVQSRKVTALYMDDSTRPAFEGTANRVQLPDGRVIGWASK